MAPGSANELAFFVMQGNMLLRHIVSMGPRRFRIVLQKPCYFSVWFVMTFLGISHEVKKFLLPDEAFSCAQRLDGHAWLGNRVGGHLRIFGRMQHKNRASALAQAGAGGAGYGGG
jgi:hypothetical protein